MTQNSKNSSPGETYPYEEVWNIPYNPVRDIEKNNFGTMTTYTPPLIGLKKLSDSKLSKLVSQVIAQSFQSGAN